MFWLPQSDDLAKYLSSQEIRDAVWPPAPGKGRLARHSILLVQELEDRVVPTLLGQELFPSDNPWNQNISNAPVAANSAAIISHIGATTTLHPDWGGDSSANGDDPLYGIPINIVHGNSTASVNVIIDNYPGESDLDPVPIPANAVIEGDYQGGPNPNGGGYNAGQRGDSHLIVWDEDTNIAYELYGVTRPSDATLFPTTDGVELPHTDGLWHAAAEAVWNMNTNTFRTLGETSADAAGLSILAGLARPDEGLPVADAGQGAIDHALRFTLPADDVNPQYIYPASHIVNESQASDNLPFGGRLRLADTPTIDALINAMPPESQILAHAMQQYGLILADIGSAMYVSGTSATIDDVDSPNLDLTWNLDDIFASNGLEVLKAADFQVVNLTPVVTGLSARSGPAGSTVAITGQNFSGAAGELSVFFGRTAASSVSYVSDSQIMALVPNDTGTVDVTVQSGVTEADSSSRNANVNYPIFGYGTSAITAADEFTYSGLSVSPTNSQVSFASSTDRSGANDLLTIVLEDSNDDAVSGLGANAFNFSLAGGTSAGTLSAVTPSATPGTFTAVFTGTTAGTASTLTVTVNGVGLTPEPTVQVATGPVSATTSTASFASPTVAAGNADLLTLVVKDAAGNAITGLLGSAFLFALTGGSSSGIFGTVAPSATPGMYTARFNGTTAGTTSTLIAFVDGVILNKVPAVVVVAGPISATASTIIFATPDVAAGSTDVVRIAVRDSYGNLIAGLSSSAFSFLLTGKKNAGKLGSVSASTTPGIFTIVFTGTKIGAVITVTAKVGGTTLETKPTVRVVSGKISKAKSTLSIEIPTVAAGNTVMIAIVVNNNAGNPITGLASNAFKLAFTNGESAGMFGVVTATTEPGTYEVAFTGTRVGNPSKLTVKVRGVKLTTEVVDETLEAF